MASLHAGRRLELLAQSPALSETRHLDTWIPDTSILRYLILLINDFGDLNGHLCCLPPTTTAPPLLPPSYPSQYYSSTTTTLVPLLLLLLLRIRLPPFPFHPLLCCIFSTTTPAFAAASSFLPLNYLQNQYHHLICHKFLLLLAFGVPYLKMSTTHLSIIRNQIFRKLMLDAWIFFAKLCLALSIGCH